MKEFGVVDPVIANRDGTVIGGHQRIRAAERLGLPELPVIYVELPKDKGKALNLALNWISGEWDEIDGVALTH
jgi:ParB-like chromosome segregation protein Spo0J